MTRIAPVVLLALALAGCASWNVWPFSRPSPAGHVRGADRLAAEGDYSAAVAAYDEFLVKYADDPAAPRVRMSRDTIAAILANREEMARLRQELARLREDLAKREGELARVRQDLERLKQIDLRLERRGKKP